MKKTEKRYMTMREAMEYTGMGELTLLGMLQDIDVYPVQPGRAGTRRFIDKADIDEAFRVLKNKQRVRRHVNLGHSPF